MRFVKILAIWTTVTDVGCIRIGKTLIKNSLL